MAAQDVQIVAESEVIPQKGAKALSSVVVRLDGHDWRVDIAWKPMRGRQEPVKVTIESVDGTAPVRADLIRRLPIGFLQDDARRAARERLEQATDPIAPLPVRLMELMEPAFAVGTASGPRRGQALSGQDLEAIAAVYRRAWGNGEPVTAAVADAFHIAKSTAAKRIMKAREAGLLDGVNRITREVAE